MFQRLTSSNIASAIGSFFPDAFEKGSSQAGRLSNLRAPEQPTANFSGGEWSGSGVNLHKCLNGFTGVPEVLEIFLEQLDKINPQQIAYHYALGLEQSGRQITIWQMHVDSRFDMLQTAKPSDLPKFFFVARLAEIYTVSTGDIPSTSSASLGGRLNTAEARWLGLFHAALATTGLVPEVGKQSNDNRTTLLKRLAGKGAYAREGSDNQKCLANLASLLSHANHERPISWRDGFLTERYTRQLSPCYRSLAQADEALSALKAMAASG